MRENTGSLLFSALIAFCAAASAHAGENVFYRQLAAHHAPVLHQAVGWNPKADAITRFDFDGDWFADNNWDNLDHFATPAHVYYDVRETLTHYFITYAFFHARDYSDVCFTQICHDNDLEGAIFTVRKTDERYGRVVAVDTLAHYWITTTPRPIRDARGNVALFIEPYGHGVHAYRRQPEGLVYFYGGVADDPRGARSGEFRYDLLSIRDEFWGRISGPEAPRLFMSYFNHRGSRFNLGTLPLNFNARRFKAGAAKPPWAWTDITDRSMRQGDWFLDPAWTARNRLPRETISLEYLHNPYLGI